MYIQLHISRVLKGLLACQTDKRLLLFVIFSNFKKIKVTIGNFRISLLHCIKNCKYPECSLELCALGGLGSAPQYCTANFA